MLDQREDDEFGRRAYDNKVSDMNAAIKVIEIKLDSLIKCQENTAAKVDNLDANLSKIEFQQAKLPVLVEGAKLALYVIGIVLLLMVLFTGNTSLKEIIFKLL